jgi:DNA-binding response OmpR family regulator
VTRPACVGEQAQVLLESLDVQAYAHGAELLCELARSEAPPPSLVVLEPERNGNGAQRLSPLEVMHGLAGLYGLAPPPTIVLVPEGREPLLAEALRAGAADAVLEPWRAPDLCARAQARARPTGEARPRVLDAPLVREHLAKPITSGGGALFGLRLVVGELSQSTMTRVLKALRLDTGELAALKVLDPEVAAQDTDLAGRFAREQLLLRGVEHPNLVTIRDAGTLGGLPFLDMDYVPGETLQERLKSGCLPLPEAVRIASQIASGLSALHACGIVHRDVKPENVLVDAQGQARLCDFGLSKAHNDAGLTREGEILGTVAFIAPEVLCGSPPAFGADVYALGITLFELLTAKDAILPGPPDRMFRAAVQGEAQQRAMRELPDGVRPVVTRMLAVDPGDRYSRLEDLIADLEACLS